MKIYESTYKDIEAVTCETAHVKAVFLPKYGAKLTSMKDAVTGKEYMQEDPGIEYRKPVYGGNYVAAECSAFDDMYPTIDSCICNDYPWKGAEYPDHGEVYALNWNCEIEEEVLHMWVYSVRFGYRMDKWVEEADGALRIRYQVENLTGFPFNGFYAAHCMLAAEEGMEIVMPYQEGASFTTAFCSSGKIGRYGTKGTWPVFNGIDLSRMPAKSEKDSFKFFFDEPAPEGFCGLKYNDGKMLTCRFDPKEMPYMCVWYNPGGFKEMYSLALEPGSGAFDRPDVARLHGKCSILKGYETRKWFMAFDII